MSKFWSKIKILIESRNFGRKSKYIGRKNPSLSKIPLKENKLIGEGWERQGFNEHVCNQISLHRNLGDRREQMCMKRNRILSILESSKLESVRVI